MQHKIKKKSRFGKISSFGIRSFKWLSLLFSSQRTCTSPDGGLASLMHPFEMGQQEPGKHQLRGRQAFHLQSLTSRHFQHPLV